MDETWIHLVLMDRFPLFVLEPYAIKYKMGMVIHTQLKRGEINDIAACYALNVIEFKPLGAGSDNSNYLLRTQQGDYVLTIFEELTAAETLEKARLLQVLEEYDYPATRILPTSRGELVQIICNKPVIVKDYINGNVCRVLNETMLWQVGAAMARLHQIPLPRFFTERKPFGISHYEKIKGRNIDAEYETWAKETFARLGGNIPAGVPSGLIHCDMFFDNILFAGERLVAVIDFMEALPFYLAYDLGIGLVGMCGVDGVFELAKARCLVEGYQSIRKLNGIEREKLQFFAEYAATAVSYWRFWRFYIEKPDPAWAGRHLEMKNLAVLIRNIPGNEFLEAVFPAPNRP